MLLVGKDQGLDGNAPPPQLDGQVDRLVDQDGAVVAAVDEQDGRPPGPDPGRGGGQAGRFHSRRIGGIGPEIRVDEAPLLAPGPAVAVNRYHAVYRYQRRPALAAWPDGSAVVVWQSGPFEVYSGNSGQDGYANGIVAQRFDAMGGRLYR